MGRTTLSSLSSSSLSSLAQLSQLSLSSSTFSEAAIPKVTTTTTTTQQRPRSTCGGCLIGFLGKRCVTLLAAGRPRDQVAVCVGWEGRGGRDEFLRGRGVVEGRAVVGARRNVASPEVGARRRAGSGMWGWGGWLLLLRFFFPVCVCVSLLV